VRLATVRYEQGNRAVRVDGAAITAIGDYVDLLELLRQPDWRSRAETAEGPRASLAAARFAPLIPQPEKIVCVGLNYRKHILEMGRELPAHPTIFAKFACALVGAGEEIHLPEVSEQMDWEAELAVVVGKPLRRATELEASAAIAGFTILNDVTARDWQYRTSQWLQGKSFEFSTPLGPIMVTDDEFAGTSGRISCEVNGQRVQDADISDLVFGPARLLAYISQIFGLVPGDIIATGTPGGVGHARTPPCYLEDSDVLVTSIEGIGTCQNLCKRQRC
jgi:acylpyruvate hydrolase